LEYGVYGQKQLALSYGMALSRGAMMTMGLYFVQLGQRAETAVLSDPTGECSLCKRAERG